jgi:hypothetical protein
MSDTIFKMRLYIYIFFLLSFVRAFDVVAGSFYFLRFSCDYLKSDIIVHRPSSVLSSGFQFPPAAISILNFGLPTPSWDECPGSRDKR